MNGFQISTYQYHTEEIYESITIVALSDIHNNYNPSWSVVIKKLNPNCIFIVGDLVLGRLLENTDSSILWSELNPGAYRFIKELLSIAPVYMSLGNHEVYMSNIDIQSVKNLGVGVLDNEYVKIGNNIILGGFTSGLTSNYREFVRQHSNDGIEAVRSEQHYCFYHSGKSDFDLNTPDYVWLDDFEKQNGFKILLSHHPEYWALRDPMLRDRSLDLVLSGHAHGGQIRFFNRSIYAPGQGLNPRYTKGEYKGAQGAMIVTTGLANTYKIPRLFNPFEIIEIDIACGS